jgi:hypothetical protein
VKAAARYCSRSSLIPEESAPSCPAATKRCPRAGSFLGLINLSLRTAAWKAFVTERYQTARVDRPAGAGIVQHRVVLRRVTSAHRCCQKLRSVAPQRSVLTERRASLNNARCRL